MTSTEGGPVYVTVYASDDGHIVECACTAHDCPELAEGTDLCLACRHGACPDDTE